MYLHMEEGERGRGWLEMRRGAGDQSSIASSWSAKSSNMLPMSSKMETDDFELELRVGRETSRSLAVNEAETFTAD